MATVTELTSTVVIWKVNNVTGGSAANGVISPTGLYTAPMSVPNNPVVIKAVSQMDSTISGTATALIKTPGPTLSTISPTTTPYGQFTLICTGVGFTSSSLIWVNGVQYPTTFVNSGKVQAVVGIYATGQQLVRVINPGSVSLTRSRCTPRRRVAEGAGAASLQRR